MPKKNIMNVLRRYGFESLAWAVRRFYLPVPSNALVLEVGAGGNPYPRANVLLDAYEATQERHWVPLVSDRPTVLGFVENLPFKDQAFDYVVAAHVLEHSASPEKFISELERVAPAGYIEVPDAFLERINPYRDHRLEITYRDQTLVIRKKSTWRPAGDLVELYENRVKSILTRQCIPQYPFEFHVRYYWQNRIAYTILNPEVDAAWDAPLSNTKPRIASTARHARERFRDFLRTALSQRKRNANINLVALMRCPKCLCSQLRRQMDTVECPGCGASFPIRHNVFDMNESK